MMVISRTSTRSFARKSFSKKRSNKKNMILFSEKLLLINYKHDEIKNFLHVPDRLFLLHDKINKNSNLNLQY